jgi:Coenzyme F420-dependent N5,N10-methylene tetrahydromethanopterin reductase and related flavin-dependent oxidoreductases
MRIAFSLGSLLSVNQVLECSKILSKTNVESVWIPETWGMENFSMLGAVANNTTTQKIGSSIINIYSRSPSTIAMGALTTDILSNGRLILGLGTSSVPIVEDFHGVKFDNPVQRMKEYVEIIRLALTKNKLTIQEKFSI